MLCSCLSSPCLVAEKTELKKTLEAKLKVYLDKVAIIKLNILDPLVVNNPFFFLISKYFCFHFRCYVAY